jgi:hypothetical protein
VAALEKRWDRLRASLDLILDKAGRGHGRSARRRQRVAGARLQGKGADRPVTRIGPGVVSPVAELRDHERQAAEELGQWKTHHEERKVIDASQAAITCRKPSTACAPW